MFGRNSFHCFILPMNKMTLWFFQISAQPQLMSLLADQKGRKAAPITQSYSVAFIINKEEVCLASLLSQSLQPSP